jgi:hypothetical protein
MQRSGGRSGRPFGHLNIVEIEIQVRQSMNDHFELVAILSELGFRKTNRAEELRALITKLLGDRKPRTNKSAGPMFEYG